MGTTVPTLAAVLDPSRQVAPTPGEQWTEEVASSNTFYLPSFPAGKRMLTRALKRLGRETAICPAQTVERRSGTAVQIHRKTVDEYTEECLHDWRLSGNFHNLNEARLMCLKCHSTTPPNKGGNFILPIPSESSEYFQGIYKDPGSGDYSSRF